MNKKEIKVKLLQNYMYSAFDAPGDSMEGIAEADSVPEAKVQAAFDELDKDELFSKFEQAAYDLIDKMVGEHNQRIKEVIT